MQVVILCGGLGTRIGEAYRDIPKSLIPVAGVPFIERQFALLKDQGLTRVVLCTGHHGDLLEEHLADGSQFGMQVSYSREAGGHLMGTGGALVNAFHLLEDPYMVLYGDSYLPTDYTAIIAAFEKQSRPAQMTVFRNEGRWDSSNVSIDGDRVVFYSKEAPPENAEYIDYGLNIFRKEVVDEFMSYTLPLDLGRIQQRLVARDQMAACEVQERFYEIGKPEGLAELEQHLLSDRPGNGSQ